MPDYRLKYLVTVTACADGTFIVSYTLAQPKSDNPNLTTVWYQILRNYAVIDYGLDVATSTSGCGIGVTVSKLLPQHEPLAAASDVMSALRQGYRFAAGGFNLEPIPVAELGAVIEQILMLTFEQRSHLPEWVRDGLAEILRRL